MDNETNVTLTPPVGELDHSFGRSDAIVTLVEYGDYECPYCGAAHPIVGQVREIMGERLRFVFRNFPLTQIHPHAERAAEAAEAAAAQGKFWEMHDTLYENQKALDDAGLLLHAETAGLNVEKFVEDLRTGVHQARVREDFMSGVRSDVNGTPTFFINGVRHDGDWQVESLIEAINEAIG